MGVNDVFIQNIQRNLGQANVIAFAREQSANKLAGAAQVAQGASLEEVKRNAPMLDRVFGGGATIQGANDQYIEQTVNKYTTDAADNMGELRKQDPTMFANSQVDLFSQQMTGDASVDNRLTLHAKKAIQPVVAMQNKQHLAYVQEQEMAGYLGKVNTAFDSYNAVSKVGDEDDTLRAGATLLSTLQRPERMDTGAYKETLVQIAQARAKQGDSTVIDYIQKHGLITDPQEQLKLTQSEGVMWDARREQAAVQMSADIAGLYNLKAGGASVGTLMSEAYKLEQVYGKDAIGSRLIDILKEKAVDHIKSKQTQQHVSNYINGHALLMEKSEAQAGFKGTEELINQKVAAGELTATQGLNLRVGLWSKNDIKDEQRSRQWSTYAQQPLVDGKINPNLEAMLPEFEAYFRSNTDKALDMFNSPSDLQRFLSIRREINSGYTPDEAARLWSDKDKVKYTTEYLQSKEVQEALETNVDNIMSGNLDLPFLGDEHWTKYQNTPWIRHGLKEAMKTVIATSSSMENIGEAGYAYFRKHTEVLNGRIISNQGASIQQRTGLAVSGDTMITSFLQANADMFGTYDVRNIHARFDPTQEAVSFYTEDEQGRISTPPGTNLGVQFPLNYIKDAYVTAAETTKLAKAEQIKQINKTHNMSWLQTRDAVTGNERTDEEREQYVDEVYKNKTVEEVAIHSMGADVLDWWNNRTLGGQVLNEFFTPSTATRESYLRED